MSKWLFLSSCFSIFVNSFETVIIQGNQFFFSGNGSQFIMRGVEYPSLYHAAAYEDLISNHDACRRDIAILQALGINTIIVYWIDPKRNHDYCMNELASAGMYALIRLDQFTWSWVDRGAWTHDRYAHYLLVIDAMAGYDNTIGFIAGQTSSYHTRSVGTTFENHYPLLKAAIRDSKRHLRSLDPSRKIKDIPVGYVSHVQDVQIETKLMVYMSCDEDHADFVVGKLIMQESGWHQYCISEDEYSLVLSTYSELSVPVIPLLAICAPPDTVRSNYTFPEVDKFFEDQYSLAGGIFADYLLGSSWGPGLVSVTDGIAEPLPAYTTLSSKLATITPHSTINLKDFSTSKTALSCPTVDIVWNVATKLPLAPNQQSHQLCSCMMDRLECRVAPGKVQSVLDMNVESHEKGMQDLCNVTVYDASTDCHGIVSDRSYGSRYGAFSLCNQSETFSWATNKFFTQNDICYYQGDITEKVNVLSSVDETCLLLLREAGEEGISLLPESLREDPRSTTVRPFPSSSFSNSSIPSSSVGLSNRAIAGIVASTVIIILLIGGIAIWLLVKKKSQRSHPLEPIQYSKEPHHDSIAELCGYDQPGELRGDRVAWELPGHPFALRSSSVSHPLNHRQRLAETQGHSRGH